jgi:hypothetical protein
VTKILLGTHFIHTLGEEVPESSALTRVSSYYLSCSWYKAHSFLVLCPRYFPGHEAYSGQYQPSIVLNWYTVINVACDFAQFWHVIIELCLQVICAVILVPVLIAVGVLMTWHFLLLLHNKTTIEVLISDFPGWLSLWAFVYSVCHKIALHSSLDTWLQQYYPVKRFI